MYELLICFGISDTFIKMYIVQICCNYFLMTIQYSFETLKNLVWNCEKDDRIRLIQGDRLMQGDRLKRWLPTLFNQIEKYIV